MVRHNRPLGKLAAATGLCLIVLAGCGGGRSDLGQIEGAVLLDGQPLPDATVVFQPDAGGPASFGRTDAEGRYTMLYDHGTRGAVIGMHTVKITTFQERDPDADPPLAAALERLPARYHSASVLREEVRSGGNVIDFDLQSQ
ncbi:MAG: carboxypeptidase-like regulatory domain-containing protein [Pirellulaceae bacterium]|jgi:hypothetical protein|nr:carboxypeptidase-like regulatory domain-containing protein [Pirellulaceae bacterium]